ncbi:hypothetical protein KC349_g230 [Hortaea werneckii]|nr:hypothetical protein KC349_g230 [Hortaea werneckii]
MTRPNSSPNPRQLYIKCSRLHARFQTTQRVRLVVASPVGLQIMDSLTAGRCWHCSTIPLTLPLELRLPVLVSSCSLVSTFLRTKKTQMAPRTATHVYMIHMGTRDSAK